MGGGGPQRAASPGNPERKAGLDLLTLRSRVGLSIRPHHPGAQDV